MADAVFGPLGCHAAKQRRSKSATMTSSKAFNKVCERLCCLFEARKLISLSVMNAELTVSAQKEEDTVDLYSDCLFAATEESQLSTTHIRDI